MSLGSRISRLEARTRPSADDPFGLGQFNSVERRVLELAFSQAIAADQRMTSEEREKAAAEIPELEASIERQTAIDGPPDMQRLEAWVAALVEADQAAQKDCALAANSRRAGSKARLRRRSEKREHARPAAPA